MPLFRRRRQPETPRPGSRQAKAETLAHLGEFARTRVGVEAYIEPVTNVTGTTVVLVAATGEWTRRRVPDAAAARTIAKDLAIPVYDVHLTGYPARMREWNSKARRGS